MPDYECRCLTCDIRLKRRHVGVYCDECKRRQMLADHEERIKKLEAELERVRVLAVI